MASLWAVLGGIVAICLGAIGLVYWWAYFLRALAATVPAVLIFGGAIALFIGISELRDSLKNKEETDFSDLKTESKVEEEGEEEKPEGEKAKPKKTSKN